MDTFNDEVLSEYLSETRDMLEKLAATLVRIERDGPNHETVRQLARDVHTIKGSSQLFGFKHTGLMAHVMEECLERVRANPSNNIAPLIDGLYKALNIMGKLLAGIAQDRSEPDLSNEVKRTIAELESIKVQDQNNIQSNSPSSQPPINGTSPVASEDAHQDSTIRVHVDLLDNLMNLVGELVLVRNQLQQTSKNYDNYDLQNIGQKLNVVTTELQTEVMKTRMQPIGLILSKLHRLVRDSAKDVGKSIDLKLEGIDTELDKTLIEAVRDPLTHIVRNAIDHGIESPEHRLAAGKSEIGTVLIRAIHESGHVIVEITDDGQGLNAAKIVEKAVERGHITSEAANALSEHDIFQLIFLPGFSTASKVSNLSGRGVGMDIVKTNIERIGGTVALSSSKGLGTSVRLRIPLTLAIIPALLVRAAGERFAIPQVKLLELLRIGDETGGAGKRNIESLHGRPVYRLRGQLLPLICLNQVLELDHSTSTFRHIEEVLTKQIAILYEEQTRFGLLIDEIEGTADIVVKPLPSFVKDIGVYSGATIMGDGSIALTLDTCGLANKSGIIDVKNDAQRQNLPTKKSGKTASNPSANGEFSEYLVIGVNAPGQYALPLCLIHRLEEFRPEQVQTAGNLRAVKYRGALLPLINLNRSLGFPVLNTPVEVVNTVVIRKDDRDYGIEVDSIVDVLQSTAPLDGYINNHEGIQGSIIERNQVITIIDPLRVITCERGGSKPADVRIKSYEGNQFTKESRKSHHILLVEDGNFYRRQVAQMLRDAGYQVSTAENGDQALKFIQDISADRISAVVSDIEMPVMNGLDFVRNLRIQAGWTHTPVVALSSRYTEAAIATGIANGFTRYLEKLNPTELISEIDKLIGQSRSTL